MWFFFFSSRRRHTRCGRDWSSDVCSSDLEPHVDFRLTTRGDLVVVDLDAHADRFEREHHVRADVLELVHRRYGEVALLVARLVAEVRPLRAALDAGVPRAGLGINEVVAAVVIL